MPCASLSSLLRSGFFRQADSNLCKKVRMVIMMMTTMVTTILRKEDLTIYYYPISQMKTLRPTEEKQLAQGHIARLRQIQDLNQGFPVLVQSCLS